MAHCKQNVKKWNVSDKKKCCALERVKQGYRILAKYISLYENSDVVDLSSAKC